VMVCTYIHTYIHTYVYVCRYFRASRCVVVMDRKTLTNMNVKALMIFVFAFKLMFEIYFFKKVDM
jgi:hypothetical protein